MIVCHCKAVSDREINKLTASGALSCDEVAQRCRAGTDCGGCLPAIRALLAQRASAPVAASTPSPRPASPIAV